MAKKPNTAQGKGQLYRWGDGRGRVHTRPQKVRKPGGGKPHKPRPVDPIIAQANQQTALRYGQPEAQLATRASQVAPWFQQYQAQIGAQQQATAAQNQPLIDQAYQAAQNTATPTLQGQGVDPNSQASHDDQLAALGRQALATAAAGQLATMQGDTNTYFGKQQGVVAPMYQQSVQTDIGNQQQQLQREKGAYRATAIGDLRSTAQRTALENAVFNVNTANTAADNARADAGLRSSNRNQRLNRRASRNARNQTVNAYGYTTKDWASLTPAKRQQIMAKVKAQGRAPGSGKGAKGKDGLTPYQRQQNRKARNTAIQRVSDVVSLFPQYRGDKVPPVKNPDGSITPAHTPSDSEIRNRLQREKYTPGEINLALKLRHKSLTPADVRAAKRMGIWPLPKQWRKYLIPDQPPRSGGAAKGGAINYPYGSGAGQVH